MGVHIHLKDVSTYWIEVKNESRVSVEKLPGPQFGVHLWEVSAYGRCPLAEV